MQKKQRPFFLISFLPALLYWYLDAYYPVRIAVCGGLALSLGELLLERLIAGKVHLISKLNFYLLIFLGGLSFLGEEGIWFKLSPFFTGMGMGGFFMMQWVKKKGILFDMMLEMKGEKAFPFPQTVMRPLLLKTERDFGLFFATYGLLMGFLAIFKSTSMWLFFKTAGFYLSFIVLAVAESFLMRHRLKDTLTKEYGAELLKVSKSSTTYKNT